MSDDQPPSRTGRTVKAFRRALFDNLYFQGGQAAQTATRHDQYRAIAHTVRDHLVERWRRTTRAHFEANPKFVYYLSSEYLLGRQLPQNLLYTDTAELAREALSSCTTTSTC